MNRSISILLALAVLAACGTTMSVQAQTEDVAAQSDATWKTHTAFDGQISKIIEGNRYVYVFAHQAFYHNNTRWGTYNNLRSTVLYIDKQDISKGVRGLFDEYTPSGASVCVMNYNPRTGSLWVCYDNGGIDVVEDSGTMHSIKDFMSASRLLMGVMGTVSFDLYGDAWIAMERGYARIDGSTFEVKEWANLDTAVESICRVGDKVVAIMDNVLYETPESGDRSRKTAFQKHTELNITSVNCILPISSGSFATLVDGSKLSLASWRNGNIALQTKITDSNFSNQLCTSTSSIIDGSKYCFRGVVANQYENNFVPVKNGYLAFSTTSAYFLPYNSISDRLDIKSYKFPMAAPRYVGTLDFDDFWFYETRKGFYTRTTADQGATWSVAGDRIQWQGPVSMLLTDMAYSPTRGVMVMNKYSTPKSFIGFNGFGTMLLSGYKDGKWTNYSPIYDSPRCIEGNSSLTSLFNRENSTPYPINNPTGFFVDSLHPDYIIASSLGGGIIAMNSSDVKGQIFRFTDAKDPNKLYPGYMETFSNVDGARYSWCKTLGADGANVLWVCHMDELNKSGKGPGVHLMYWTPEARNQAMLHNDINQAQKWGMIFFPIKNLPNPLDMRGGGGAALKHPKNNNKIVVISNNWGRQGIVVCDHNGTLEDASDDKADMIYQIKTPDGLLYHKEYIMAVAEDPVTGNVWLSFNGKLISVDLTKPVKDGIIEGTEFKAVYADGSREPAVMSDFVYSIAFDEYNRMWVGTCNSGVYGISADRRKVMAHYDMTNSPMLSNQVDGLCWDPDGNELMIGTDMGLHSVKPDQAQAVATGSGTPMAYPVNVLPEYKGNVKFVNLPTQTVLSVTDAGGRHIKQLPAVDNGQTIWDVCDSDGQPVPQGVYTVRDVTNQVPDFRIIVSR